MTFETKKLGNQGEEIAVKYLKEHGYKILDRNFRYKGYGELDMVAKKSENLVFIEVKTRIGSSNDSAYKPEDNITYSKQKQLIKLAKIYFLNKRMPIDIPWQIDIIAIDIDPLTENPNLRHIEKAIEDIY